MKKKVLIAMSGGVDSSAAALLLQKQGYECAGATLSLCGNETDGAKRIADGLGMPFYIFDEHELFAREVMDHFVSEYRAGRTPNPCIDCNRYLKFAALQRRRAQLGFDYVATGHYARRAFNERTGRFELRRGLDEAKDQSYVLYHLTQDDLAHMLFPLGELTKPQVRELAEKHSFGNAHKAESQDICFVPDGDYASFIARYMGFGGDAACGGGKEQTVPAAFEPGDIVDVGGKVLGRHTGLVHYTIGQRKGIGVAAPEPLYVVDKDAGKNVLVVGPRSELGVREVRAGDVNLISVAELDKPMRVTAKTHYRQRAQAAEAVMEGDQLVVRFDEAVARPAAGQSLVFYDGDAVVGGGTIETSE